jgi:hypothetical protein
VLWLFAQYCRFAGLTPLSFIDSSSEPPTLKTVDRKSKEYQGRKAASEEALRANPHAFDESDDDLDAALRQMAGSYGPDAYTGIDMLVDAANAIIRRLDETRNVWCNPAVIKEMKRAWALSMNGTTGNEAVFMVNGSTSYPSPRPAKTGNFYKSDKIIPQGNTIAIFHVHPNSGLMWPSTPDNNWEHNGKGDTGEADARHLDMYVMSRDGLTYYDHLIKRSFMLRSGLDWTQPCGAR